MKKIVCLTLSLTLVFALAACGGERTDQKENLPPQNTDSSNDQTSDGGTTPPSDADVPSGDAAPPATADFSKTDEDMFTSRDAKADYDVAKAIKIELYGTSAAAGDKSVIIDGTTVTITKEGTYLVSGTLQNGQLAVAAPDDAKIQIVLNGVNITSGTSAALCITQADKVFLTLVGENTLANGGSFETDGQTNIDGAVYSKQDLTLNGQGKLTVTSPAGHGIVCKDDLVLYSGTLEVTCANHGLDANDSVRVKNAALTLKSGKDGIHCENTDDTSKGFVYISGGSLDITADGDGIDAGAYLQILSGDFKVTAGGGYENGSKQSSGSWGNMPGGGMFPGGGSSRPGSRPQDQTPTNTTDTGTSMKGLKAESGMLISSGSFKINSADDGLHSNSSLILNGGTFEIASGDDGVHAEEEFTVTAGSINITQSYEGLEAIHIKINGGDITVKATDDGINAAGGTDNSGLGGRDDMFGGGRPGGMGGGFGSGNGSITISGGKIKITASGDGIDANGTLDITGGHTTVTGPTQGDTAVLDYDKTGTVSGGTFIGTGSSMMAQSLSSSTQGVIAISTGSQSAGTLIKIEDASGNVIVSHTPELNYQITIISSPQLKKGETYKVTVGSQSADIQAK